MSRNAILVFGLICWAGAAADAAVHLLSGDLLVPVAMGTAFVAWVAVRRRHYARQPAEARVPVEA